MLTRDQFYDAAVAGTDNYPTLSTLYQTNDPALIRNLRALASMLAMMSANAEIAQNEPFIKSRAATVLADSAMRGIVRKSMPARAKLLVSNSSDASVTIDSARIMSDADGRPWRVETSLTLAPEAKGYIEATQIETLTLTHQVAESTPLYAIHIPDADDSSTLCSLDVIDSDGFFEWRHEYINVWPGERVFHVESDDRLQAYVRFGIDGTAGWQPPIGHAINVLVSYSFGDVTLPPYTPFAFDYLASMNESLVDISFSEMLVRGQDPISLSALRDLASYPALYDDNAVFLGEFDYLVRKRFYSSIRFLSVWSETAEERVRGVDIRNMNKLFVAIVGGSGAEQALDETNPASPTHPQVITQPTAFQDEIKRKILAADDSYRVVFYTPVKVPIVVRIWARISTSYIRSDVIAKIRETVLANYGEGAIATRRNRGGLQHIKIAELLKASVDALGAGGRTDLNVQLDGDVSDESRPELWRFVTPSSLTVEVEVANILTPGWS